MASSMSRSGGANFPESSSSLGEIPSRKSLRVSIAAVVVFALFLFLPNSSGEVGVTGPLGRIRAFFGYGSPQKSATTTVPKSPMKECQEDIVRSILQSDSYKVANDKSLLLDCGVYNITRTQPHMAEHFERAVSFIQEHKLTFLKPETLEVHKNALMDIDAKRVPGMILECGVAKGGSSIVFAAVKSPDRCMHLHDTFQGIPPPSTEDGEDVHQRYDFIKSGKESKDYYGYMSNLMEYDQRMMNMSGFYASNIHYHKGLFNETVFPVGPVAYAHLDGDWYFSVIEMLERITPWLSVGGWMILDDVPYYSGAQKAFEHFFQVSFKDLESGQKLEVEKFGAVFELSYHVRVHIQKTAVINC